MSLQRRGDQRAPVKWFYSLGGQIVLEEEENENGDKNREIESFLSLKCSNIVIPQSNPEVSIFIS